MKKDFSIREQICFDFLSLLEKEEDYVVIGGYAVSSFGFPRFSVDLDVIISDGKKSVFHRLIADSGFVLSIEKTDLAYAGVFERHRKGLVSIDLLINAVQSRQTGYSYPFSYVFTHSVKRQVTGWDPVHKARVRIAKKELLIALKLHSLRDSDTRDIIMLCYETPDVSAVVNHLMNGPKKKIAEHVSELLSVINDQHFKDSLKGVFRLMSECLNDLYNIVNIY